MKIVNGIIGFIVGLHAGFLFAIIEMKWMMRLKLETALPFVVGITVLASALTGIFIGIKIAKRK